MATNAQRSSASREDGRNTAAGSLGLTDKVKDAAGWLADQGMAKLTDLAEDRKEEVAQKLDEAVGVVRALADNAGSEFGDMAGGALHRGGDAVESVAQALRNHSVEDAVTGTRSLIVRHPGAAIAAASVVGFLAGRIAKGGIGRNTTRASRTGAAKTEAAA